MALPGVALPPCCASCSAYDGSDRVCRLLAEPTLENRRALLTMPCDVQRLLTLRFRGHPPDVARDAIVAWLDPAWDADDVSLSYGRAPRDARLWLGSWPYLYLARTAVRRGLRSEGRERPIDEERVATPGSGHPTDALRVARALEATRRIDAVGYAMLTDVLADRFDAAAWATSLGAGAATISDRRSLALYRYAVIFHDVLPQVEPPEARAALVARRFSPGDPDEQAALVATRTALGTSDLSLGVFREQLRAGAARSLELLAAPDALGSDAMAELERAFRRVLRLDVKGTRS